jgi:DNA-directed RNA polymerase subunit H (RpoH/RPB5)
MEDTALATLRTMLGRRKLDTKTDRVTTDEKAMEATNLYTIGGILVVFSQKDKVLERDINNFLKFAGENTYTNGVIIVAMSPPSDNVSRVVKSHAKQRVQFFHIRQLQFDITTHRMAMPHRILNEDDKQKMFEDYKISDPANQLPYIDSQDTMVKWVGAIPGDVIEVLRHSDSAGRSLYYRYCVEDVSVTQ